jgi:hypothetical protein
MSYSKNQAVLAALELEQVHPTDQWMHPAVLSSDRDVSQDVPREHRSDHGFLTPREEP